MESKEQSSSMSNFSSLTAIMKRFQTVPYEQFQQELQEWFTSSLKAQGRDVACLSDQGFPNLPELISKIYHQAEVMQTLSDSQIKSNEVDR